jgi:hypothetical protein
MGADDRGVLLFFSMRNIVIRNIRFVLRMLLLMNLRINGSVTSSLWNGGIPFGNPSILALADVG